MRRTMGTMGTIASILAVSFLAGCPAKPRNGECKTSEDCAAQEGYGKTCVEGRCQECGQDTDCKAGFVCQAGKCVAAVPPACPEGGGKLLPVYFAFDRALLTPESQAELARNATCIKDRKFTSIIVEGNCDERGTGEYNLQLGQRRAEAARKYLVNLGIPARSIKTVSYGKERPVCTDATEACWQRNRRDDVIAR
jgi:peptidoglycan-associated lipoprotein